MPKSKLSRCPSSSTSAFSSTVSKLPIDVVSEGDAVSWSIETIARPSGNWSVRTEEGDTPSGTVMVTRYWAVSPIATELPDVND